MKKCPSAAFYCTVVDVVQVIPRQHIRDVSALDDEALREWFNSFDLRRHNTLPVVHMVTVGESLLAQRGFGCSSAKMGFHVPPFTSVQHLHLHCLSLPLNNMWRQIK